MSGHQCAEQSLLRVAGAAELVSARAPRCDGEGGSHSKGLPPTSRCHRGLTVKEAAARGVLA
eukprot:8827129-Alexandrium_andersonii.AAC.1